VIYKLPELLAADTSDTVYVVEGEKDADQLAALGLVTTTNPQGAGKWREEYTAPLVGRRVVILPDNDKAGSDHVRMAARSLIGKASSVKVLELPGLLLKGDVSDYLAHGGARDSLIELAQRCPEWVERAEDGEHTSRALVTRVSDVETKPVDWLWPDRIPLGKFTLFQGDPCVGKSFETLDIAARVSTGNGWPDSPDSRAVPGDAILLSAEDDVADAIRSRLEAAGADLSRVHVISGVRRTAKPGISSFSLADDLCILEHEL